MCAAQRMNVLIHGALFHTMGADPARARSLLLSIGTIPDHAPLRLISGQIVTICVVRLQKCMMNIHFTTIATAAEADLEVVPHFLPGEANLSTSVERELDMVE